MKKRADYVSNGMIMVPDISIEYKGYVIRPKLDMGSTPWLSKGNNYRRGYIVVKDGIQIMPGAIWFHSIIEARVAVDILIEVNGDGTAFWKRWYECRGLDEYEDV